MTEKTSSLFMTLLHTCNISQILEKKKEKKRHNILAKFEQTIACFCIFLIPFFGSVCLFFFSHKTLKSYICMAKSRPANFNYNSFL